MFCHYNTETEEQVTHVGNKRKRSNSMRNYKKSDDNKTTDVCNNGNGSDLEEVPSFLQPKNLRSIGPDAVIPLSVSEKRRSTTITGGLPDGQGWIEFGSVSAGTIVQLAGEVSFTVAKGEDDTQTKGLFLDQMQKDGIDSFNIDPIGACVIEGVWRNLGPWKDPFVPVTLLGHKQEERDAILSLDTMGTWNIKTNVPLFTGILRK